MENYPEKASIKFWAESDRPREKLLLKGKSTLSDAELIAILLGSGSRNESAVDLSKRILASVKNNLIDLSRMTIAELSKFKGIGEAKSVSIVAALELGRRRRGAEVLARKSISSSADAFEIMQVFLADSLYEQFMVIFLNRANQIIHSNVISDGGVSGTVVDPRRIYKLALENNSSSIILGHNHPSGNVKPSNQDIQLTKKVKAGGALLDIAVLDHLIIGLENYYSFADEGLM